MNRMMAIVEREMRKFFRSPALMLASMIFPLVQLIILGNAFGGKIHDARVAIVDQDGGPQALRVRDTVTFAYQRGGASLMDFLNAQSDYRQVQLSYAQLIGAYLTAAGQLNMAVGTDAIQ